MEIYEMLPVHSSEQPLGCRGKGSVLGYVWKGRRNFWAT